MFRRALEIGVRFVRRTIRDGLNPVTHSTSSVPNVIVRKTFYDQVQPSNVENFFFAHWLKDVSRNARSKCNPVQRMVGNRRTTTPLFLGFVGFTFLGLNDSETVGSSTYSSNDDKLHQLLQDMLQNAAENIPKKSVNLDGKKLKDFNIGERLGQDSCNSAVYEAKIDNHEFALKMLFNYSTNSQSASLKKGFAKELEVLSCSKKSLLGTSRYTSLPAHFNVMKILWDFADEIQLFPDSKQRYPAVLPPKLCRDGYGRNRTLYHVMPKFSTTLREFIARRKDRLDTNTSLALLVQLLEGLCHLNKHGIAHRDLKSDNLLIDESTNGMLRLVITDFDGCLAEESIGLKMPYRTYETCKGGNAQLMAPEVYCAEPGPDKEIDYSKSDEWAAGPLAYEMFGQKHPFEDWTVDKGSYDVNYLPQLDCAPKAVRCLVKQLLQRHPNDRPDISVAATACQMMLWRPELFDSDREQSGLVEDVRRWFENKTWTLTLDISKCEDEQDMTVEQQVLLCFLLRTNVDQIINAIEWLNGMMAME